MKSTNLRGNPGVTEGYSDSSSEQKLILFFRILKLRNQLLSQRGKKIWSKDPNSLEDILRKGFSTGVSYMYSSLFEVSQWCKAVDFLGKKITLISCFGEISGSRGMERNIFYLISKSVKDTGFKPGWGITCRNDIMLIHFLRSQGIVWGGSGRERDQEEEEARARRSEANPCPGKANRTVALRNRARDLIKEFELLLFVVVVAGLVYWRKEEIAVRVKLNIHLRGKRVKRYWLMLLSKILETLNQLWDSFLAGEIPLIVVELCGWDVQSLDDKRLCAPV
ncbi:hypothetical protein DKX38_030057 (mitochondrion) [Salix brachista]|uniref:ATP synthase YMF19 uncharacterized C-terminal domain-containing protein n=1 Tax=Salix brachista TaxID=2182728 RepID=A0A5N5IWX4_9ROSI|nr:hypothetical protein DKX38_030057 [Salix brachista]